MQALLPFPAPPRPGRLARRLDAWSTKRRKVNLLVSGTKTYLNRELTKLSWSRKLPKSVKKHENSTSARASHWLFTALFHNYDVTCPHVGGAFYIGLSM